MTRKKRPTTTGDLTVTDDAPEVSDIHKMDYQLANIKEIAKARLSRLNYKLFCDYDDAMVREPLAKPTRLKNLKTVVNLSEFYGKHWRDVTRKDIQKILTIVMEHYSSKTGRETHTTFDHKKILRLFVRWVMTGTRERDSNESELEILKDVKMKHVTSKLVREEMLTDEDMIMLSHACGDDLMFKAFIWVAYDAGTRPGEILTLRIKDITIESDGWLIQVDGKTGQRPIHLVKAVPYLSAWLNSHPFGEKKDWPLWIIKTKEYYGRPLSYQTAVRKLEKIRKISGIQKKLFLNLFRHSEVTNTSTFMPEALLKKRHGWSATSKVPANYQHMIQDDVKESMQKHYGIKPEEKEEFINQKCGNCGTINPLDIEICNFCHLPISIEKRMALQKKHEDDTRQITRDEFKKLRDEIEKDK